PKHAHAFMSLLKKPAPAAASEVPPPPAHARLILALIVFLAGAAVMIIEICANRLLAPVYGNSVFTWTSLIGVILICFSAGGYLGGYLADKRADFAVLGWLLATAAVLTMFVPAIFALVGMAPAFKDAGVIAGPVMISTMLFALPGVLLGAVSPASLRLYSLLGKDAHVGFAAGTISMLGSLGSFVGTFLAGFYLVSHFSRTSIFVCTGGLLFLLAVAAFYLARHKARAQVPVWVGGLIALTIGATSQETQGGGVIYQHDSLYHRIRVTEQQAGTPNAQRYLELDSTTEGGMQVSDGDVVLQYQQFWRLPTMKSGFKVDHALFIGAGAFGMPEQVSKQYPESSVDVAEIDPAVIETGRKYFKLDEFPRVDAHASDARRFLAASGAQKWDFVFGDAYNGMRQIPLHLASKEFFQLVHEHLTPQGIFLMNVISSVEGPRSELLAGMVKTLQEVFAHVEIFAVARRLDVAQNVMILASNDNWGPVFTDNSYVSGSWEGGIAASFVPVSQRPTEGVVFTDDLNPVDAIIARGLLRD
ncbi:MAG: hypothetical protein JWO94_2626, partial [Verrucomicrobiaceae bacterium]|nr:hypothetical protein [Verrucomicrobiaceae bacterium]